MSKLLFFLSTLALLTISCTCMGARFTPYSDTAAALSDLRFFHDGRQTPSVSGNLSRLTQCNGFSECLTAWTCSGPRDYLWDISGGRGVTSVRPPPMGARSAVPLGGIGAGTFELRGDGSFADWMIDGQGTALAANDVQNSKVSVISDAYIGIYASASANAPETPFAATLRTKPPNGLPGVDALIYSGAHPFSRLRVDDVRAPFSATLFAYSAWAPGTAASNSALPVAIFSVLLSAPPGIPNGSINASLMLSLPLSSATDVDRPIDTADPRNQTLVMHYNATAASCLAACDADDRCTWWRYSGPGSSNVTNADSDCPGGDIYTPARIATATLAECVDQCVERVLGCTALVWDQISGEQQQQCGNANPTKFCCLPKTSCSPPLSHKVGDTVWMAGTLGAVCTLYARAPGVEQFKPGSGVHSGVSGRWATSSDNRALTLRRNAPFDSDVAAAFQDPGSASGASYTLLASDADADVSFSVSDGPNGGGSWDAFAATGRLPLQSVRSTAAGYGAIAARVPLRAGENRTITIIFAWHLQNRMYVGQNLGNAYTAWYNDSLNVAQNASSRLIDIVSGSVAWNVAFASSSAPEWLIDFLLNSVSVYAKMSVWVAKDSDLQPLSGGRFRQFEAYSGCDLAPVHVLDYSMLPLALMFPELLQNELRTGWAVRQGSDGMILEFLGDFSAPGGRLTGQMDISAGGRVMGDVTTVFILATLAVVLDDSNGTVPSFAVEMWPSIVRAARWQINRAHALGCPNNLQTTYDYLGLDSKAIATYNAFLHNAAMRAVVELAARVRDNSTLSHDARASEAACSAVINSTLWRINGTDGGWWRAWQDANGSGAPDYILSGALHGQSWASVLGLGFLAPVERIAAHVAAETALNCDYKPAGCPLGLLTLRQPGTTWSEDASPSQSMDATVARLISGAGGLTGSPAEAVVQLYRETHHDLWHWMDLHVGPAGLDCAGADISGAGLAGQPFVNSHYARQLQGWAVFLSWTGQRYNGGRLTFSPTCEGARPTRSVNASQPLSSMAYLIMPFITPGAVGTVTLTWVDGPRGNGSMLSPTCTLQQLYGDLVMSAATVDLRRCIGLPRSIAQKADCILERF